jgi:branched-chain amino acid transport system permease protein
LRSFIAKEGEESMALFITAVITGISIGAVYGMIAVGYTVVYNATRVFNLAQGDLLMVGVMISYFCLVVLGWPQLVTLLVVIVGVTLLSVFEERVIVRPFLSRSGGPLGGGIGWFIATLAFSQIVETVVVLLYGNSYPRAIPSPLPIKGWQVGSVTIAPRLVLTAVALVVVVVALELILSRTWTGRAMRATAEDREAASLRGIEPSRVSMAAFALGGVVAAIGAYTVAPIVLSDPTIGLAYTLKGFLALAIGGFGSVRGAIVGAICLGIAEQLFGLYVNGGYDVVAGLLLLMLVFAIRPTGIFGAQGVRTV